MVIRRRHIHNIFVFTLEEIKQEWEQEHVFQQHLHDCRQKPVYTEEMQIETSRNSKKLKPPNWQREIIKPRGRRRKMLSSCNYILFMDLDTAHNPKTTICINLKTNNSFSLTGHEQNLSFFQGWQKYLSSALLIPYLHRVNRHSRWASPHVVFVRLWASYWRLNINFESQYTWATKGLLGLKNGQHTLKED